MKNTQYKSHFKKFTESYRTSKMDDLVDDLFYGDYEGAWEALWRSESIDEIRSAYEYIARMNDFEDRGQRFRNQGDYAEALEEEFGYNYEKLYTNYVLQMSDKEFKDAEKYIKRMYMEGSMNMKNKQYSSKFKEAETNVKDIIKTVIDTDWSKDNESQMKVLQLMRGIATSDEKISNDFMKKIDKFTSSLKVEDFKEASRRKLKKPYEFESGIELISYGMSPNGNKTITVLLPDGTKKSVQTNIKGLFFTHSALSGAFKDMRPDELKKIGDELKAYYKV